MNCYKYLNRFLPPYNYYRGTNDNWFEPLSDTDIEEAERLIGFCFPNQLRSFYKTIGYGFLTTPNNPPADYYFSNTNRINSPDMVADIIIKGPESGLILEESYEFLEHGDLPFFEIGDSTRFLVMKAHSDNPNAVWAFGHVKIEDSFEKFIWRLYYESPWFYDDIIESHYKRAR